MPDPFEPSSPTSSSKNVFRYQPTWNPTEDGVSSIGYSSRKALPIKKPDAHWLTREDVQFDLLDSIFNDRKAVFSTPVPGHPDSFDKVSFGDLYIHAIYNSPKCSKVIKDKIMETPAFAIELGKVSLLTNIGRINTTMAFFPEMKTALRTYHPLPSLQKTDGNLTDAPRLKTCLKAALLPSEIKSSKYPSTPQEIIDLIRGGQQPPTSVVNLIFVLATHYAHGSKVHFDGVLTILDLFLPKTDKSAASRAQAFLWLMFHYLEGGAGGPGAVANPFDDDFSRAHPGKAPALRPASQHERLHGDHDTEEEIRWGKMMANRRLAFLEKFMLQTENDRKWKVVTQPPMTQDAPDQAPPHVYDHDTHAFTPISRNGSHSSYGDRYRPRHASGYPPGQGPRSMLEQAWLMIHNTNPLEDSSDEGGGGGGGSSGGTTAVKHSGPYILEDYEKRLAVLKRLRGKSPTPEPAPSDKSPMDVDDSDPHHPHPHQHHRPMDVDHVLTIRHHNPHQQSTTSTSRRGGKSASAAGTTTATGTRTRRSGGAKKGSRAATAHAVPIEIVDT